MNMNREQAEKLLAALVFDDLDEASKAQLHAYLQTDDDLRDRLADLRMAAKLTRDAVQDGPEPVLHKDRLRRLEKLARTGRGQRRIILVRRLSAVAAVVVVGLFATAVFLPHLSMVRKSSVGARVAMNAREEAFRRQLADREAEQPVAAAGGRYRVMPPAIPSRPCPVSGLDALSESERSLPSLEVALDYKVGGRSGNGAGPTQSQELLARTLDSLKNSDPVYGFSKEAMPTGRPSGVMIAPTAPEQAGEMRGPEVRGYLKDLEGRETAMLREGAHVAAKAPQPGDTPTPRANESKTDAFAGVAGQPITWQSAQEYSWSGDISPTNKPTNLVLGEPLAREASVPATPLKVASNLMKDDKSTSSFEAMDFGVTDEARKVPVLGDIPALGRQIHAAGTIAPEDSRRKEISAVDGDWIDLPMESGFKVVPVNPWVMTAQDPRSTFGLDVDTASYALCRQYIRQGLLPPAGAVRMEEFVNAFDYLYPQRERPTFAIHAEGGPAPFAPVGQDLTLLKVAVKACTVGRDRARPAHLVFVVDGSASMDQPDRLPLVQQALGMLVDRLSEQDCVSLVTCSDQAHLVAEAVSAQQREPIRQAIAALQPAGPTNLLAGLKLGYATAQRFFQAGRINHVVLCSDGVANVGQTEAQAVLADVAQDRRNGITLTCVGVGFGAYNDAFLEALANGGDGRYVFLDGTDPAVLVGQLADTLQTVARDARIQVEFNQDRVRRYRLIGYENRAIEDARFRDDTVDAGEVGSGQCSTALYELELLDRPDAGQEVLGTVFVRYRDTDTDRIEEISRPLTRDLIRGRTIEQDPRFFLAAGVARFAEWLRQSEHARDTDLADIQAVLEQVRAALPLDQAVADLVELVQEAKGLPRAQ